ncbi:hypothetical protein IV38_GL001412 [Lactobacillus selangorensis]|uniref:Permease n=1 Tax=Lactobacillus selangorensis TaxID=81857 RepID=A0A0R2FTC5_9LACO|nr:AI-2E family transporter [Lactobacillus selangorensis]KRN28412.1 hypothetical protein IV38_GL001412 [Lactobacillus selangorensis]KRN31913.1 hypothetical protein IV40_GL001199 [Lactobacillus selangorensis]
MGHTFKKLQKARVLYWSLEILVVFTAIWVLSKINFIFAPIGTFITVLFGPILVAGFLFYLFNPLIVFLGKHFKISRGWAIGLIFLLFFGGLIAILAWVIPNLISQLTQLIVNLPDFVAWLQTMIGKLNNRYPWFEQINFQKYLKQMNLQPSKIIGNLWNNLSGNIPAVIGSVTGTVASAVVVPIMLFYMLKDGNRIIPDVQKFFPQKYRTDVADLLDKMSDTISSYIAGQAIECLFVGCMMFVGYMIIGMPYAFLFGFVSGVATMIPYIGSFLGFLPAFIVALTISVPKAIFAIVVVVIVQQLDGNLVYPNVIGRTLNIHPLTIVILLTVAGNAWGLFGVILAIPVYAVLKTVVSYLYDIYQLRQHARNGTPLKSSHLTPPDDKLDHQGKES